MKKNNKAEDFLKFMMTKQEIEKKMELQRKNTLEKPMTTQEFNKFKMDVFKEVSEMMQKMNGWISEGMSKEDISWFLAYLSEKKDDKITSLFEEAKQTYINEANGYYKRRIKNQDELFRKIIDLMKQIKQE